MTRFLTISILALILLAAVGAGYGLAVFTESIEAPWASAPNPPATTVYSSAPSGQNRPAGIAATTEPGTPDAPEPTANVKPTATTSLPTDTPRPTYTPAPTPTRRPTPTPTPVPTPTPTPVGIAKLPWIADGIDESERAAFRELSTLAETNPPVARVLLERSWVIDGVDGPEKAAIQRIENIGRDLPTFAVEVAELPWLADDVTQPESEAVEIFWETSDLLDLALAKRLIALSWVADDVTHTEAALLSDLRYMARGDITLAARLADLSWLANGLDEFELTTIERLAWIADQDVELAKAIAYKPWLGEISLSNAAARTVNSLYYINYEDTALAKSIATMPFLDTLEPTDAAALESLSWLAYTEIFALREVLAHPTLEGGITDEWAPVVALMDAVNEAAPAFLRPLLDPEQATVERRSITLPHSGATDLAIIRTGSSAPRSMDLLEHSVGSVEEFMGTALPTNYVGLLFGTAVLGYSGGTNYGGYFVMLPEYDADDGSDDADYAGHLMAHEVAHYYWRGNPNWLDEGLAELLAAISENERTGAAVSIDYTYCPAGDNIALLERLDAAGVIYDYRCNYALGGQFFLELYNALGDAAFRQGLRNLYLASLVEDYADEFDGSPVGIRQIQDALQSDASVVNPIIDKWYHGTAP